MADTVFTAKDLTKTYTSGEVEVLALQGLDLEIWAGWAYRRWWRSGCPVRPIRRWKVDAVEHHGPARSATSGHLFFRDLELTGLDDHGLTAYRRRHVGFVFQFYNLIPSLTAKENVALVTEISERPMRPEEALAMVGLEARMDHFPAQLLGGEQQRVAIARAIAKRPEVLLCDEPTGALDSKTGIRVIALLDIPNFREPATGQFISLPEVRKPTLNQLYVRIGRAPEPSSPNEVVVSESFAKAHGFAPGSRFSAILNGRKRQLVIVGIALSPEFVFAVGPGDIMPDDRRFGIVWMSEKALASAYDLEGGFSWVNLKLLRDAPEREVIQRPNALAEHGSIVSICTCVRVISGAFLNSSSTVWKRCLVASTASVLEGSGALQDAVGLPVFR